MIKNIRVNPFQSSTSKSVAFVSCAIETPQGDLYLNNMTLVNGSKGLFLSFPSRKLQKPDAKGNEYQNHYFMGRDLKEALQSEAIKEYEAKAGGSFAGSPQSGYQGGNGW